MSLWQGKRQEARGKSEEVLGDFTFLYIPLNFYVHLLILPSIEALKWAFEPGNSTKQQGVRQGEGLHILQEFVQKNHGSLMIFSNDSYVNIGDNGVKYKNICTNFSGTLVNIAFRCDEKYYCLASEVPKLKKLKL